jgi:hypothetical protein
MLIGLMLDGRRYHITVFADRIALTVKVVGVNKRLALGKVAVATGPWLKAGSLLPNVAGGPLISAQRAIGVAGIVKGVGAGVLFTGREEYTHT